MRVVSSGLPKREPTPQAPEFTDRILSPAEVGEITGLGRSTIERARKDGELKFIQLTPRRVGLRASELQRWLNTREHAALKASEAA
jgi:excisionase family DNA binding protein